MQKNFLREIHTPPHLDLFSIDCSAKHQLKHQLNSKLTPDPYFLVK